MYCSHWVKYGCLQVTSTTPVKIGPAVSIVNQLSEKVHKMRHNQYINAIFYQKKLQLCHYFTHPKPVWCVIIVVALFHHAITMNVEMAQKHHKSCPKHSYAVFQMFWNYTLAFGEKLFSNDCSLQWAVNSRTSANKWMSQWFELENQISLIPEWITHTGFVNQISD